MDFTYAILYKKRISKKNIIMDFRGPRPELNLTELDIIAAIQDTLLDTYCSPCPLDIGILLISISAVTLSLINIYISCQKTRLIYQPKNDNRDTDK